MGFLALIMLRRVLGFYEQVILAYSSKRVIGSKIAKGKLTGHCDGFCSLLRDVNLDTLVPYLWEIVGYLAYS